MDVNEMKLAIPQIGFDMPITDLIMELEAAKSLVDELRKSYKEECELHMNDGRVKY